MGLLMIIAAFACLASGCGPATPSFDPATPGLDQSLGRLLDGLHTSGRFDGAVVVSDASGIRFERGYGWADAERKAPFTPETPTDGASLAKTFTAALVLGLVADGAMDLDQSVTRWLPELPYPDVSLRHLLSHSSGIPVNDYGFFDRDLPPERVRTTESLLKVLAARKPRRAWPPGTAFEYSSFGYDLAALAAARAGKGTWFDLLKERFFAPLGIASAFARPGRFSEFPGLRTRGYRRDGTGLVPNEVFDGEAFHGGSNLYISVRDLDRWNVSFLRGTPPGAAALAQAGTPATVGGGTSGLTLGSWYRRPDRTAFWYSGHLRGFHSEVFRDVRRGWSVVYTSNNTIDPWLQKGLVRAIVAVLEGGGAPNALTTPEVEAVPKEARGDLAGVYEAAGGEIAGMPGGATLTIEVEAGRVFAIHDSVRYEAFTEKPEAFYVPGLDCMLGFAPAAKGGRRLYVSTNVGEGWIARREGSR